MNAHLIAARPQPTHAPGVGRTSNTTDGRANEGPEPTVRVARYAVSCLPQDHEDAASFTVWAECRGPGRWFVIDGAGGCYGPDGFRRFEPRRSERTTEWDSLVSFGDSESALAVAMQVAPLMRVNGVSVADVLAQQDGGR